MMPLITGKNIEHTLENLSSTICRNITPPYGKHAFRVTVDGKDYKIVVKTNNGKWQESGEIILGTYKRKYKTRGWLYSSDADYICFCLADKFKTVHKMLFLPLSELRKLVKKNSYRKSFLPNGDYGYFVPIEEVEKKCNNVMVLERKDDSDYNLVNTFIRLCGNNEQVD